MNDLTRMVRDARSTSRLLGSLDTERKNGILLALAREIEEGVDRITQANARDLEAGRAAGLGPALLDRLLLDEGRARALAADARRVAELPDPVGTVVLDRTLPNGLRLVKRRIPIGVVAVIYESRPNVTVEVATLCLKSGNAVILRGGRESLATNAALVELLRAALRSEGVPDAVVGFVDRPDRELVGQLLRMDRWIDMVVPRGGPDLHRRCREESTIPVMTGGIGICHTFVDDTADLVRAVDIVENAKVQRPSVCNALDTLLVHRTVARDLLPPLARRLAASGVELRADEEALEILRDCGSGIRADAAGPEDFDREWLSLVLGVRVVDGVDQAIEHVRLHSTQHSDAILTRTEEHARRFVDGIDSAAVYVNASTRFTDGGQFGLGAEVAVSTQKLHARGPMGLEDLTTTQWVGYGDGQIRD